MVEGTTLNSTDLVEQTKDALDNALDLCKLNNLRLTVRKSKNNLSLVEVFELVMLDYSFFNEIEYLLRKYKLQRMISSKERCTLGNFLSICRSLTNAKRVALSLRLDLKNRGYEEDEVGYFDELIFCLERSVNISRLVSPIKRTSNQHFQEHCSLCWRLVDKYRLIDFSDSENYSLYYCHVHHPSLNTNEYHKFRNKLFRAVRHRGINEELSLIKDIKSKKLPRDSAARHTHRLLSSFSKKPSIPVLRSKLEEKRSWNEFTLSFLKEVYIFFPAVERILNRTLLSNYCSWKSWFLAVIKLLGNSADLEAWKDCGDFELLESYEPHKINEKWVDSTIGWIALLTIFARYQAHQNVVALKLKKGRKAGISAEGEKLREKIRNLASEQIEEKDKINAAEIGRKVSLSRERVSVLLKELGLR
ncbi:hypothetical protein [Pseudoalteromonas sp. MEBiC 03485]|uniref:hypothetical protein n=1 Tax=Pseudoalteromonas sp. MEBiC 03485 TaxID=2571103 RepID=UPI0010228F80|nr:hypothetical protein [Pseudoalteromonas sp. MEBiC 03485]RZD21564.1 hypothetical protein EVU92_05655 [Pseudoalteromonas sp. MEBiC 03485]